MLLWPQTNNEKNDIPFLSISLGGQVTRLYTYSIKMSIRKLGFDDKPRNTLKKMTKSSKANASL